MAVTQVDEAKLEQVAGQALSDAGAALNGVLVLLGGRLGLWRALAGAGPLTSREVAERSGVHERYVREWLAAQTASGHLVYDADGTTFTLPPEQAMLFADEDSPVYMLGGYQMISSAYKDWPRLEERFRAGEGFGWDEHHPELFDGTETFFRPAYRAHLLTEWIPSLDGVEAKLGAGGKVADIGCGHGVSTTLIAQAFPQATVHGFDYHAGSIERARELAREQDVNGNVRFEVASATDLPDDGYDLVCFFDCLHDMGDPVGALRHVRDRLAQDGTVMLVEPYAGDGLAENLTPYGRLAYAASTVMCVPCSLAQEVALGLGAQAGERRLGKIAAQAGFSRFRRASETPFNLVLEIRP
jgi:SAM-dependent methyltransferase